MNVSNSYAHDAAVLSPQKFTHRFLLSALEFARQAMYIWRNTEMH